MKNIDLTHNQENAAIGMVMAEDDFFSNTHLPFYSDYCDTQMEALYYHNLGDILANAANALDSKDTTAAAIYRTWAGELHKFAQDNHYPVVDMTNHSPNYATPLTLEQVIYLNMLSNIVEGGLYEDYGKMIDILYGVIEMQPFMTYSTLCITGCRQEPADIKLCDEYKHLLLQADAHIAALTANDHNHNQHLNTINALKFAVDSMFTPQQDYQFYWQDERDRGCWWTDGTDPSIMHHS